MPATGSASGALQLLSRAFERVRLDVAGPLIEFDPKAAVSAAEFLRQACWAMVCRNERAENLGRRLSLRVSPRRALASTHLSVDLTFRYLPQVLRRARGIDPDDVLVSIITDALCSWPLSGVLAEVDEPPAFQESLEFDGHSGLMLLYAERLAAHDRPAWRPAEGTPLEYFELVAPGRAVASRTHHLDGQVEDSVDD